MANALYPKCKEQMWQGGINASSGTVKVALIDTGTYTYSAAHEFFSSITGVVGTPVALSSKTFTGGLLDAADTVFPAITGVSAEALILYIDTGTPATSRLIAYFDTGVTGLPVTPNGGDANVVWNAAGIAQL